MEQGALEVNAPEKPLALIPGTEDSLKAGNILNDDIDNNNNNYYLNSILKIPDAHSIRYEIGSLSQHIIKNERQILRISDFSTKASLLKRPSPYMDNLENAPRVNEGQDISQWEEVQRKTRASEQRSFRPISKPEPAETADLSGSEGLEDFECSMENEDLTDGSLFIDISEPIPLNFLSNSSTENIKLDTKNITMLQKFVDKLQDRNKNFKVYTCDICNKNFNNHAALGGHKAKNHPHSSKSFIERKKTFELRKSERKKREFLRNF